MEEPEPESYRGDGQSNKGKWVSWVELNPLLTATKTHYCSTGQLHNRPMQSGQKNCSVKEDSAHCGAVLSDSRWDGGASLSRCFKSVVGASPCGCPLCRVPLLFWPPPLAILKKCWLFFRYVKTLSDVCHYQVVPSIVWCPNHRGDGIFVWDQGLHCLGLMAYSDSIISEGVCLPGLGGCPPEAGLASPPGNHCTGTLLICP